METNDQNKADVVVPSPPPLDANHDPSDRVSKATDHVDDEVTSKSVPNNVTPLVNDVDGSDVRHHNDVADISSDKEEPVAEEKKETAEDTRDKDEAAEQNAMETGDPVKDEEEEMAVDGEEDDDAEKKEEEDCTPAPKRSRKKKKQPDSSPEVTEQDSSAGKTTEKGKKSPEKAAPKPVEKNKAKKPNRKRKVSERADENGDEDHTTSEKKESAPPKAKKAKKTKEKAPAKSSKASSKAAPDTAASKGKRKYSGKKSKTKTDTEVDDEPQVNGELSSTGAEEEMPSLKPTAKKAKTSSKSPARDKSPKKEASKTTAKDSKKKPASKAKPEKKSTAKGKSPTKSAKEESKPKAAKSKGTSKSKKSEKEKSADKDGEESGDVENGPVLTDSKTNKSPSKKAPSKSKESKPKETKSKKKAPAKPKESKASPSKKKSGAKSNKSQSSKNAKDVKKDTTENDDTDLDEAGDHNSGYHDNSVSATDETDLAVKKEKVELNKDEEDDDGDADDKDDDAEGSDEDKPFPCPECKYRARKKGQLRKHLAVHNIFQCAHCDFTSDSRDLMEEHMRENHPTRCGRKLCKKCNVLFRLNEIEEHEKECTGEKKGWACKECKKEFKFYCAMKTHYERWHTGKPPVPKYNCEECDFEASNKASLRQHMKESHVMVKNVKCPEPNCESVFRCEEDVNKHRKKVHEKPVGGFPCSKCSKSYSSESTLKAHLANIHGDGTIETYPCDVEDCGEVFKSRVKLVQHRKQIHKLDPPKFKCTFAHCDLEFLKVSHLKRHEVTHTGERKYRCDWPECGKAFRHADNLRVHYRRHTNEKPLKCDLCGASYRQKNGLKYHMEKAHGTTCPPAKKNATATTKSPSPVKEKGASLKKSDKKKDDDAEESSTEVTETPKAGMKTETKLMSDSADSQLSTKDVYEFNDSDDEGLDLKMLPKTPLKGSGTPRIRPDGDHLPFKLLGELPLPDMKPIKDEKEKKKKSSKKKKEPSEPKPPKEKKEKKTKKPKEKDNSKDKGKEKQKSESSKETKTSKSKSKSKSKKKKEEEKEKETTKEEEIKKEEEEVQNEEFREESPSLVPTPAEENVEEGPIPSESQDEARDTPTPPILQSETELQPPVVAEQEEEEPVKPETFEPTQQPEPTEPTVEPIQLATNNDTESAAGSLENFDDRCDQWVNAPAPQEKLDSDLEEDQVMVPPGEENKDALEGMIPDVPSSGEGDLSQRYQDMQNQLDSGGDAYTEEEIAKAARDLLGETSDHQSEIQETDITSPRDVNNAGGDGSSMQHSPSKNPEGASVPTPAPACTSGEVYNPAEIGAGMPGLPAPPAYGVGNYGEANPSFAPPPGPENIVPPPQEKVPNDQPPPAQPVQQPIEHRPTPSEANKYNFADTSSSYTTGNYVSGAGSERGPMPMTSPTTTQSFSGSYPNSQPQVAPTTTTSYSTAGSSFMDSPLYLSSRPGESARSLPSAAPFPSETFSGRDFFGQYFQDPGTLPLTHPPLSQDQRLSYHPAAGQSSLSALQRTNADLLRRAATGSLMPPSGGYPSVTESLVGMNSSLGQTSQQPWMVPHDDRSRSHWGQPSPILPASEIDSTSPLSRNPYSCDRPPDYTTFDPNNPSAQLNKRTDSSFPTVPQTVANPSEPRYDMASYMGTRGFGGATGSNYGRSIPPPPGSASTASKHLEEAYRHAAHITDYTRGLPQAPGVADVYSRMGMNPTAPLAGLDKYNSYWRDPMYRSQPTLPGSTHPFIPPTTSAAPTYGERDYGRSSMYSQHGAYSFMGDKQYLGATNKVPQGVGAPGHLPADYLQHATPGAPDPHMQDPYRRSMINYMMPRYF